MQAWARCGILGLATEGAWGVVVGDSGGRRCDTCRGPVHSWATVPVSFHSSALKTDAQGRFSAEELATVKRFPLVTIEKWQGCEAPAFVWEEDAMVAAASQIKTANPAASVVVWLDSIRIYTGWNYPASKGVNRTLNPDASSACTTGHFRPAEFLETHPDYLLKNVSGQPALESWSHCHIYDFTKAQARAYWLNMCLNMTSSGVIDGCGADASWQNGWDQRSGWHLDDTTARAWQAGHASMMKDTTQALGDGLLLGKKPSEVGVYVNGALWESCPPGNSTIQTLRNLTRRAHAAGQRMVFQCHTMSANEDTVASFLIGAGKDHYLTLGTWTEGGSDKGSFATHWNAAMFEPALGDPRSDATYDSATAVWTRSFGSGTQVTFNVRTGKGKIAWGRATPAVVV